MRNNCFNPFLNLSSLLFILFLAPACSKQLQDMDTHELTKILLLETGVSQAYSRLPSLMESSIQTKNTDSSLPSHIKQAMTLSMGSTFDPELLVHEIFIATKKYFNRDEIISLIEFNRSNIGRKIKSLEQHLQMAKDRGTLQQYAKRLERSPPTAAQVRLAREVIKTTGSLETSLEIISSINAGMLVGMMSTVPANERPNKKVISQEIIKMRTQLAQSMAPLVLTDTLYMLERLPPKVREKYLSHLKKGIGKKYRTFVKNQMSEQLSKASLAAGQSVARNIAGQK